MHSFFLCRSWLQFSRGRGGIENKIRIENEKWLGLRPPTIEKIIVPSIIICNISTIHTWFALYFFVNLRNLAKCSGMLWSFVKIFCNKNNLFFGMVKTILFQVCSLHHFFIACDKNNVAMNYIIKRNWQIFMISYDINTLSR